VSSGSGTVYVYLDSTGALTFGVAATGSPALACSGCQAVSGVVSFPPDSLPLASWGVTSGLWDAVGTDLRTMLSTGPVLKAGQNVALASTLSTVTISAAGATGLLLANPSARTSDISDSSFTQESPNNGVASPRIGGGAVLPVCAPESRGMFFHLEAARGLADSVRVCTKDASGRYLWRKVF